MAIIKDDLGREFLDLSTLSDLLNLSLKQTRRHIRDKRLLSIKQGQRRFVLTDDILREYPSLTPSMLKDRDITDTKGTSPYEKGVPNVPDVPKDTEIDLYRQDQKQDLLIRQVEQVKSVVSRLEKGIADIGYIQRDTKSIDRKLDRLNTRLDGVEQGQKRQGGHWLYPAILGLVILGLIGAGIWGFNTFKDLYQKTQAGYEGELRLKDEQIDSVVDKFDDMTITYYEGLSERDIEIERLQKANEGLGQTIEELQKND